MSQDDDGGIQFYEEVSREQEMIERAKRDSELLEAHRKWIKDFNEQEKSNEVV